MGQSQPPCHIQMSAIQYPKVNKSYSNLYTHLSEYYVETNSKPTAISLKILFLCSSHSSPEAMLPNSPKKFPWKPTLINFFLYSPFLLSLVFLLFPERNLKFLLHTHFQFYLLCPLLWFCIINTSKGVGKEWRLMAQNRIFLKVSFKNSCHIYDSYPHITWYKSKHANNYKFSFLLYYWFVNFGYPSLS